MSDFYNLDIDDYLLGLLQGKELEAFEAKLKTDSDFANTVMEQKQVSDLINKMSDRSTEKEFKEFQQKYFETQEQQTPAQKKWFKFAIATAIGLLLLGLAYYLLQKDQAADLHHQYYAAYDARFGNRGAEDDLQIKLAEASRLYKNKKYTKALPLLDSLNTKVKDVKLQLALGVCHLETGKNQEALVIFNQIYKDKDPVYQYHGLWYSAMTYLKMNDLENTKAQLEILINTNDPNEVYKETEAKELLRKL